MRKNFSLLFVLVFAFAGVVSAQKYHIYKSQNSAEAIAFVITSKYDALINQIREKRGVYYSRDAKTFFKVMQGSSKSFADEETVEFTVPEQDIQGKWHLEGYGNTIQFNDKTFVKVTLPIERLTFMGYPVIREPRTLLKTIDDQYILVSQERYFEGNPYDDVKVFFGPADNLKELTIQDKDFMRCGSYIIKTTMGLLDYHTIDVAATQPSRWNSKLLYHLNESSYQVIETNGSARVKKL